jgi:hypothetical protein
MMIVQVATGGSIFRSSDGVVSKERMCCVWRIENERCSAFERR